MGLLDIPSAWLQNRRFDRDFDNHGYKESSRDQIIAALKRIRSKRIKSSSYTLGYQMCKKATATKQMESIIGTGEEVVDDAKKVLSTLKVMNDVIGLDKTVSVVKATAPIAAKMYINSKIDKLKGAGVDRAVDLGIETARDNLNKRLSPTDFSEDIHWHYPKTWYKNISRGPALRNIGRRGLKTIEELAPDIKRAIRTGKIDDQGIANLNKSLAGLPEQALGKGLITDVKNFVNTGQIPDTITNTRDARKRYAPAIDTAKILGIPRAKLLNSIRIIGNTGLDRDQLQEILDKTVLNKSLDREKLDNLVDNIKELKESYDIGEDRKSFWRTAKNVTGAMSPWSWVGAQFTPEVNDLLREQAVATSGDIMHKNKPFSIPALGDYAEFPKHLLGENTPSTTDVNKFILENWDVAPAYFSAITPTSIGAHGIKTLIAKAGLGSASSPLLGPTLPVAATAAGVIRGRKGFDNPAHEQLNPISNRKADIQRNKFWSGRDNWGDLGYSLAKHKRVRDLPAYALPKSEGLINPWFNKNVEQPIRNLVYDPILGKNHDRIKSLYEVASERGGQQYSQKDLAAIERRDQQKAMGTYKSTVMPTNLKWQKSRQPALAPVGGYRSEKDKEKLRQTGRNIGKGIKKYFKEFGGGVKQLFGQ